jgi:small glutamine-rich tetratricopeptide repeat-containing protein alpha
MNSILYCNRALGYLKKDVIFQALEDCNKSIELNENYARAYLRRGEARMKN